MPQSNNLFLNANDIAIVRELEYNTIQMSGRNQEVYYRNLCLQEKAADKWGISQRRVAVLCSEQRLMRQLWWAICGLYQLQLKNQRMQEVRGIVKAKKRQLSIFKMGGRQRSASQRN